MGLLKILVTLSCLVMTTVHSNNLTFLRNNAPLIVLPKEEKKEIKEIIPIIVNNFDFAYIEISTFPSRIKEAMVGGAIGYRVSHSNTDTTDFSFHAMKTLSKEVIYCGKINHLYYLVDKTTTVSPYVGFGFILGLAAPKANGDLITSHYHDSTDRDKEYAPFMNGEIVVGAEFVINNHRQFLELTYYAGSSTLQLSLGIGL